MKTVIQRVAKASAACATKINKIGDGILALVSIKKGDSEKDARYLAGKVDKLRIFKDDAGKMNLSVKDTGGEILAVPQFTLYGDCSSGRRPSFDLCAPYSDGERIFNYFVKNLKKEGVKTMVGFYGRHMSVRLENDGPVTFIIES